MKPKITDLESLKAAQAVHRANADEKLQSMQYGFVNMIRTAMSSAEPETEEKTTFELLKEVATNKTLAFLAGRKYRSDGEVHPMQMVFYRHYEKQSTDAVQALVDSFIPTTPE